jgi:hypothetical protein
MRLVLLLLLVQFLVPSFVPGGSPDEAIERKTTLDTHHDSGISVAVFLKENTEEENKESGEKSQLIIEILDFSFLTSALTLSHSSIHRSETNIGPPTGQLFKLFCVFLI